VGVTLAIDAMSGDRGPASILPAIVDSLKLDEEVNFLLTGQPALLRPLLGQGDFLDRVEIVEASEVIAMDESPISALRRKKDSSMRRAIDLVNEGRAQAVVSAGNTGALMAISTIELGLIDGIERPAIASFVPNRLCTDAACVLDLGANVDCSERMLLQFAAMGSALTMALKGIPDPSVSLLNVGVENIKGSEIIKKAITLFEQSDLNFRGSIEGDGVFDDRATDVIVCDGFSGNVVLKTIEGLSKMIKGMIEQRFRKNLLSMSAAALVSPILRDLRKQMDPRRYNGASFVGLKGAVVKSHGDADAVGFGSAIQTAVQEAKHQLSAKTGELTKQMVA